MGQGAHWEGRDAPSAALNVLAGQGDGLIVPRPQKLPSGQGAQELTDAAPVKPPKVPAGQGGQSVGAEAPGEEEYVPAGHRMQEGEPGGAKDPSGQHTAAPAGDDRGATQGAQLDAEAIAGAALKKFAAQGVQAEVPGEPHAPSGQQAPHPAPE